MENDIIVSVIVITYNQEKYIRQALNSVVSQVANFSFEILVGDDASTDRTSKIIREYSLKYPGLIIPVFQKTNVGAARNAYDLCKMAKGKYLAFCEGDDYWLSDDKLQLQVDFLENHKELVGCSHRCVLVDKAGVPLPFQRIRWVKYKKIFSFDDFAGGLYLPGQTSSIVKRNIFMDTETDLSVLYLFDKDISDRIANMIYLLQGNFGFVDRKLSAYRMDYLAGSSITGRKFTNNRDKLLLDLSMTKYLERYVSQKGRSGGFYKKRSEILAKAVALFLLHPDKKSLSVLKTVFSDSGMDWKSIVYIPVLLSERFFLDAVYWIKG